MSTINDIQIKHACIAMCRSGKFETGQGTCALVCMDQLGSARTRPCTHAVDVFGALCLTVVEAALESSKERIEENEKLLKQALTRNLNLRKALECIAGHDGLTLLCPDETASVEWQTAHSEGVSRGFRNLAEFARDALKANPFPGPQS